MGMVKDTPYRVVVDTMPSAIGTCTSCATSSYEMELICYEKENC
jgi:hypothetical protein